MTDLYTHQGKAGPLYALDDENNIASFTAGVTGKWLLTSGLHTIDGGKRGGRHVPSFSQATGRPESFIQSSLGPDFGGTVRLLSAVFNKGGRYLHTKSNRTFALTRLHWPARAVVRDRHPSYRAISRLRRLCAHTKLSLDGYRSFDRTPRNDRVLCVMRSNLIYM